MSYRDVLFPQTPLKLCTVAGCAGMMRFPPFNRRQARPEA
jgi:hypothetical protein